MNERLAQILKHILNIQNRWFLTVANKRDNFVLNADEAKSRRLIF